MMNPLEQFLQNGWITFDHDRSLENWIQHALPYCRTAISEPGNRRWLRHGDTWFAGVNALDNDADGSIARGPALSGPFLSLLDPIMDPGSRKWDRGQISVCYPGYPKYSGDEPEAAFRYRRKRDAAHIDGLLRRGSERRRYLMEYHEFILGIPMVPFSPNASPFVVWQGSHHFVRETLAEALKTTPSADWPQIDLTTIYNDLRQQIFERCNRITIHTRPGQAFVVHRHCLHGMAPWADSASAGPDGRMICYFRPPIDPYNWLTLP